MDKEKINLPFDPYNPTCAVEEHGWDKVVQWEQQCLKEYGWYAHFVYDAKDCPNGVNYHTHGMQEIFDHPDFQVCIRADPKIVHGLFIRFSQKVKEGEKILPNIDYHDIVPGYPVRLMEAVECGRPVLRILVTNPEGTYDGEIYEAQFTTPENRKHE